MSTYTTILLSDIIQLQNWCIYAPILDPILPVFSGHQRHFQVQIYVFPGKRTGHLLINLLLANINNNKDFFLYKNI